jgi:TonB family protein
MIMHFTFVVTAALTQPAPNPPSTQTAQLEARVASGRAQCADYQQLARLYRARGDFELGLTTVRTCATLAPDDPRAYFAIAAYLVEEAEALRARAQSLQPAIGTQPVSTPLDCQGFRPGAQSAAPVRVGGNIKPPMKRKHVNPVYPDVARQARVVGVVILEATIGPDGKVEAACILRSIPLLDQAAIDAVRQWEFEPTLLNGQPVPVLMTVTVNFSLM